MKSMSKHNIDGKRRSVRSYQVSTCIENSKWDTYSRLVSRHVRLTEAVDPKVVRLLSLCSKRCPS